MSTAVASSRVVNRLLRVNVTIKGVTPMLLNRPTQEQLLKIREKERSPKGAPNVTPREECDGKVYKDADGKLYLPAHMLYACLVKAGQFVRLDGKRQISTATSTVLPAFMTIDDKVMKLTTPGWEVDIAPGKNKAGEMIPLVRPRFDEWSFNVRVTIDTREIAEQKMRELFDIAGKRCGMGSNRPNCKGFYGQFVVDCWEHLTD
jgi:hypothetical protein